MIIKPKYFRSTRHRIRADSRHHRHRRFHTPMYHEYNTNTKIRSTFGFSGIAKTYFFFLLIFVCRQLFVVRFSHTHSNENQ